jgi:hypothetical protein
MADQEAAKTRTIGYLPIEKVRSLAGWDEYLDKSTKLSILRTETQKAKNSVRDDLKQRLSEKSEIDFVAEGDRIRVFQVFRKQPQVRRTRTAHKRTMIGLVSPGWTIRKKALWPLWHHLRTLDSPSL